MKSPDEFAVEVTKISMRDRCSWGVQLARMVRERDEEITLPLRLAAAGLRGESNAWEDIAEIAKKERAEARAELATLKAARERLEVQLAGCGVAALGWSNGSDRPHDSDGRSAKPRSKSLSRSGLQLRRHRQH